MKNINVEMELWQVMDLMTIVMKNSQNEKDRLDEYEEGSEMHDATLEYIDMNEQLYKVLNNALATQSEFHKTLEILK